MTVIKCDRCGREIRGPEDVYIIESGFSEDRMTCRPDRSDLCKDCAEKLLAWLHQDRES